MYTAIRDYFARETQSYAGGAIEIGRRMTGGVGLINGLISLILLAVASPASGPAWAAAGLCVGALLSIGLVSRHRDLSWDELAVAHYIGLSAMALLVFLTGGSGSPQSTLLLVWIVLFAACHPPRRALAYFVVAALPTVFSVRFDDMPTASPSVVVVELIVWGFMAAITNSWVVSIRRDRLRRMESERTATALARIDPVTGLGNRRAFDETLAIFMERRPEDGRELSVLIADLDRFKLLNDRFGHQSGDACLRDFAGAMREVMRRDDLLFRWGGDEFAAILPGCDCSRASAIGRRLSASAVQLCQAPDGTAIGITYGCAEHAPGMSADDLLAAADRALLEGKDTRLGAGDAIEAV